MSSQRPGGLGALFVVALGVWVFFQVTQGELVERLQSYVPGAGGPKREGALASAFAPARGQRGRGRVRIGAAVIRGDRVVRDVLEPILTKVGGAWTIISWHRPGAKTPNGSTSCHAHGRGSRAGAWDIVPNDKDWSRADDLVTELHAQKAAGAPVGEIIFRGDSDHDPKLGADPPHVHASVGCD